MTERYVESPEAAIPGRRVEPTVSLLEGAPYTPAAQSDIRVRFLQVMSDALDFNDDEAYRRLRTK